jgi:hypothetical protein
MTKLLKSHLLLAFEQGENNDQKDSTKAVYPVVLVSSDSEENEVSSEDDTQGHIENCIFFKIIILISEFNWMFA